MTMDFDALVSIWGWALLHFLWQGLLIGVLAAFLLRFFRQARPQVRYALACIALLLCFMLPMASVLRSMSINAQSEVVSTNAKSIVDISIASQADFSGVVLQETMHNQIPWVVIAWSIGCAFFSLRMVLGLSWIANARRHSLTSTDGSLQSKLNLLAIQFELNRPIQLLICNELDSPVTAGWWKPIVLMPAALATRLPPDVIEALLAHELAHIKRHDYLINLIQSAIEAVLFFHPVVWWLSKQIRIERENIADDLAAEILGEPRQLAIALAALDEFQFAGPLLAPAAQGGNLMSRIQRLMKPTQHVLSWKMSAVLIGLALACITVYAHDKTSVARKSEMSVTSAVAAVEAIDATEAVAVADAETAADAATLAADEVTALADTATAIADSEMAAPDEVNAADEESVKADEDNIISKDSSSVSYHNGKKYQQSYALVTAGKEGFMISGSTDDIGAVEEARKKLRGDFLWFRRDGRAYIVQDPAVIAEVKSAWKDSNKISAEMEQLGAKMEVHSKVMNGISEKMQAVSGGGQSQSSAMEKISRDMQRIGSQQDAIGRQMGLLGENMSEAKTDSQRNALDQKMQLQSEKMAVLASRMQELQALMNKQSTQLDRSLQPLDALSREMDVAAKPLEPLSKQMDVLGKKLEILTKVADEKVATIIDETVKSGQALPAGKVTAQ
jgi:beta-lactamase regulating signal transducer with metallopeptidase domain/predicted  nucleic acid-binding Zn-ribbon protein